MHTTRMTGTQDDNRAATDSSAAHAERVAFLTQFTQTLEEATWLRRLAKHFELRDVRHAVTEVAAEVLPELRQLVLAESIGLIPTNVRDANNDGRAAQIVWDGRAYTEEVVRDLLDLYEEASVERPVVMNQSALSSTPIADHGIHSLIFMPVATSSHRVGWLLVLNRDVHAKDQPAGQPLLCEAEFGTPEAGLVQTAASMLASHGQNVALFEEKERLLIGVIAAMSGAVDARDHYTHGHSRRVAAYARTIAREMSLDPRECEQIHVAGLLHDIGKVGISDAILKKKGPLTREEFDVMKRHPETGYRILRHLEELSYVLPGVLHHHERIDGGGYPHGLAGEAIPLMARILAVADGYDAMTSNRPYRATMPNEEAERILREHRGTQWDADVIDAFFRGLDKILLVPRECPADIDESFEADRPSTMQTVFAPQSQAFNGATDDPINSV